jgi:hypothetical protein
VVLESNQSKNRTKLGGVLSDSQKAVENVLNANFQKPFEVYVCFSQEVFNEYVFLSKNVRGAVYWGKLFLSPGAFSRDSLKRLTSHELTHYFFILILARKHISKEYLYGLEKGSLNLLPMAGLNTL